MDPISTFFFIKDKNGGYRRINCCDIWYVKSDGNYLQFVTNNGMIQTYGSLQSLLLALDKQNFIQSHRSYIVQLRYIDHIDSDLIIIKDHQLPVGGKYHDAIMSGYVLKNVLKL